MDSQLSYVIPIGAQSKARRKLVGCCAFCGRQSSVCCAGGVGFGTNPIRRRTEPVDGPPWASGLGPRWARRKQIHRRSDECGGGVRVSAHDAGRARATGGGWAPARSPRECPVSTDGIGTIPPPLAKPRSWKSAFPPLVKPRSWKPAPPALVKPRSWKPGPSRPLIDSGSLKTAPQRPRRHRLQGSRVDQGKGKEGEVRVRVEG